MREKITTFISGELLSGVEITGEDELLVSNLVDSIGIMRLVTFIEEVASLHIPPEDVTIQHFSTVNAIARYLEDRQAL